MVCPLRKVLPAGILCDFTLPMPVMRAVCGTPEQFHQYKMEGKTEELLGN